MVNIANIRQGQQVYGDDNQSFGTVERVSGQDVYINGRAYPISAFSRFENNRLYLAQGQRSDTSFQQGQGEIKVPVYEEKLYAGKRQVELGEVELQKTVSQEQVNIPVELRREEVNVQEIDVPDRPVQPGEEAFRQGTIRVPVRGEEALVNKQTVATGEVSVNKNVVADRQQVSDTVRKEQVTVDKNYPEGPRPAVQQDVNTSRRESYNTGTTANTQSGVPASNIGRNSATTAEAGSAAFDQTQIQEDMEVYSSDNERIGKVKEVAETFFLVGRGLFSSDIEANYATVQGVQDETVILNLTKEQVSALS